MGHKLNMHQFYTDWHVLLTCIKHFQYVLILLATVNDEVSRC